MIFRVKHYFILICFLLIFCELPYNSRCESLESEELSAGDDEFGETGSGILSENEFRMAMSTNSNIVKPDKIPGSELESGSSEELKQGKKTETKKDETKPEEPKPEETKPEVKKDETKPEESKPEEAKSEVKKDETKPEESKPEEAKSEVKKDETKPEETKKNEDEHKEINNGDVKLQNSNDGANNEKNNETDDQKESTGESNTKDSDVENETNKEFSSSEIVQEESISETVNNSNDKVSDREENTNEKKLTDEDVHHSTSEEDKKSITENTNDNKKDEMVSIDTAADNSKERSASENKSNDDKLEDNVEKTIQEMKEKLGVDQNDETIKRVDDQFIVIIKKLKQKKNEIPTDTKYVEVKAHDGNDDSSLHSEKKEEKSSEIKETESGNKNEVNTLTVTSKIEKNGTEIVENHEEKSNEELINKLKSLSAENKKNNEATDQKVEKINNLLEVNESDVKMEKLIQEKKDYDAKKKEKEKLPLQKKKKWYEKRDPITGELLFDAAALSRNITSTLTAKRRKGVFSKCVEFHGQKENCESNKNCFYDSIYGMCLFDCSLLNKKDSCEEYLECRFDFIVPRKACVNDCFQSRNFVKQEMSGIMRGCMWCTQEVMCNTISSLQRKKFPDSNYREFDCNWQVQNGLENKDENIENSLCVDRNLGRAMTDKDLVAATYISSQTKLVHEAAEKIKDQMVNNGETEETAKLHVQNIDLLKMNICYPPNIPFSNVKPEKKYYLNDEVIQIYCDDGYKITGANNRLRCENGLFSPKVYCIAQREIEKQKDSISKHFNKIINLLINSITGGGGWINVGLEKINETKEQEGESMDDLANENKGTANETKVVIDEETKLEPDSNSNTTTNDTYQIAENATKVESTEELNKDGEENDSTEKKSETKSKGKYSDKKSDISKSAAPDKNIVKKILLDRITGTPILVQNDLR